VRVERTNNCGPHRANTDGMLDSAEGPLSLAVVVERSERGAYIGEGKGRGHARRFFVPKRAMWRFLWVTGSTESVPQAALFLDMTCPWYDKGCMVCMDGRFHSEATGAMEFEDLYGGYLMFKGETLLEAFSPTQRSRWPKEAKTLLTEIDEHLRRDPKTNGLCSTRTGGLVDEKWIAFPNSYKAFRPYVLTQIGPEVHPNEFEHAWKYIFQVEGSIAKALRNARMLPPTAGECPSELRDSKGTAPLGLHAQS
jgi:hypothetical protein